jgi:hypothetical protein
MKQGNPITGYALLLVLVLLVGLVITTVARDMMAGDEPIEISEPEAEDTQTQKPTAQQSRSVPQQGRVWEGTM